MPKGRAVEADSTIRYEYVIKDHLGNSRIVFSDLNGNGKVDAMVGPANEILHEGHYYPFGLEMTGPWSLSDNPDVYDNRFNGKERMQRFGLNYHDFGARWYDAEISRWLSVDPLAVKYSDLGPYVFVGNSPIMNVDPDGKRIVVHYLDEKGKSHKVVLKKVSDIELLKNVKSEFANQMYETLSYLKSEKVIIGAIENRKKCT